MKFRTSKIAPLALSAALAFGVAACDDTADGVAEDTNEAETQVDQELTDEDEAGDADEDEGVETDDETTEE